MNIFNLKGKTKSSSDPFLDWVVVVIISIVVALLLVGVGTSVYLETEGNLAVSEVASDKKPTELIDQALLAKVLGEFDKRSGERSAVLRNYVAPSDPALP